MNVKTNKFEMTSFDMEERKRKRTSYSSAIICSQAKKELQEYSGKTLAW